MDYIPGPIHDDLKKEHFFLVNNNFCWINCKDKRWSEIKSITDWDETAHIELKKGDIIVVRFFKVQKMDHYTNTYLERVICNNGDVIEYKTDTIMSLDLIYKNLNSDGTQYKLFSDVTKIIEREIKLESILC